MKILDLQQFSRFKDNHFVKVLRHKDSKRDLWELYRNDKFNYYQNGQSWDVFGKANYIISFIAERNSYAKFLGVWEVKSKKRNQKRKGYRYRTKKLPGFDELAERLIVRWGEGTRSWAQCLHRQGNKDVVEILPPDYVMDFPGFHDFVLSYDKLTRMINNPDSNREWQRTLSSISGVYAILDTKSGKLYIGSAYGRGGLWGRWSKYTKSPSGGNILLKELLKNKSGRQLDFQFSILRVLEPSATKDEVISQESLIKRKLGSRAFGLNSN